MQTVQGVKSAQETIQQYRGNLAPSESQEGDIGAFKARITKAPTPEPGKGVITFAKDIPTSKIRGESTRGLGKLSLATTLEQMITMAIRGKVPSASALLDMGMPESEVKITSLTAKEKFAKKKLTEKLEDTSHTEIVSTINKMGLTSAEIRELLKMLPDRERQQVSLILAHPDVFAPVRGMPRVTYTPTYLRHKKPKNKRKPRPMEPSIGRVRW